MELQFEAGRADAYTSGLQRARVLTEHWVAGQVYCLKHPLIFRAT
jgi:hypothetical protein